MKLIVLTIARTINSSAHNNVVAFRKRSSVTVKMIVETEKMNVYAIVHWTDLSATLEVAYQETMFVMDIHIVQTYQMNGDALTLLT